MLGLVLSGGAARSIAHLGMLKVLDENNVKIDRISSVSGGSITGALYSYGYSPDEIMDMVLRMSLWNLFRPAFSTNGLLSMKGIEKEITKSLPARTFEDLKLPLVIAATHLHHGKTIFFSSGELIKPLLASNCVPLIFAPVKIEDALYVDGGIVNNMPVEPLVDKSKFILGMHSNPVSENFKVKNIRYLVERVFLLAINYNAQDRKTLCNTFWEPEKLQHFRISEIKHAKTIFKIGYEYGLRNIDKLLKDLNQSLG